MGTFGYRLGGGFGRIVQLLEVLPRYPLFAWPPSGQISTSGIREGHYCGHAHRESSPCLQMRRRSSGESKIVLVKDRLLLFKISPFHHLFLLHFVTKINKPELLAPVVRQGGLTNTHALSFIRALLSVSLF